MKEDNNEFENLYKKAAENFPLKADNADWHSVLLALEEDDKKAPFFINRNVFILGLLLFLVSFLYITTLIKHQSISSNNISEKKQIVKQETERQQQNTKLKQEITDAVYKRIHDSINSQKNQSDNNVTDTKKLVAASQSNNKVANIKTDDLGNTLNNNITFNRSKQQKAKFVNASQKASNKTKYVQSNQGDNNLAINSNTPKSESLSVFQSKKNEVIVKVNDEKTNQQNILVDNDNSQILAIAKNESIAKTINKTLVVDSSKISDISTPKKLTNNFAKYFYAGALFAFDNTFEKHEKHSNEKRESFGVSLLLGYKMSSKISIETGISFQNKEYYTSGNYFNKSILNATGNVSGIEAENSFIEVPLIIKYDWLNHKQHNIFTTIGLSSYFVNKEKYEYDQEIGGVYNKQFVEFYTVTTNLFATCNFSLGYQFNFKKLGSLRLQPYINLPLKGLGKSQQHIVSNGINIGWIYNFNRK